MAPPRAPYPRHVRYGVRYQARLDTETSTKIEELAGTFHRTRAAVLRSVMQWGLAQSRGWIVDRSIPASVHLVHVLVEPAMMQHVQNAAVTHRVSVAAWLRHATRQITQADFPASWRAGVWVCVHPVSVQVLGGIPAIGA
jgi:hypothetical protein